MFYKETCSVKIDDCHTYLQTQSLSSQKPTPLNNKAKALTYSVVGNKGEEGKAIDPRIEAIIAKKFKNAIRTMPAPGFSFSFIKDSAFTVVGCAYVGDSYGQKWSTIDTTIALENMVIAAWALGVGSCWIGDFKEEEVKKLLNIPNDWKVIALISFGYPAEQSGSRWKKPLTEIVSYNKFLIIFNL